MNVAWTLASNRVTLALAIIALMLSPSAVSGQGPEDERVVVVRPSTMNDQGWFFRVEGGLPSGELVVGPDAPPLGGGSARFVLNSATDGMSLQYFDESIIGLPLKSITSLHYCTYVTAAPSTQAVSLQFNFDNDVTDNDISFKGRLVFEPSNSPTFIVQGGTWQCWNTLLGFWWATRPKISELQDDR